MCSNPTHATRKANVQLIWPSCLKKLNQLLFSYVDISVHDVTERDHQNPKGGKGKFWNMHQLWLVTYIRF